MENQFSASDLSVTNIAALASVKEIVPEKKSKGSVLILIVMMFFAMILVFLSVYQFGGGAKTQTAHAASAYGNQVQQMTKQK
jgi:flagellar basal body-associated protein FliL